MSTTANTTYTTFTGWIDRPTDIRPPLTENLTCSVAVVGGGLAGMSTAPAPCRARCRHRAAGSGVLRVRLGFAQRRPVGECARR